MSVRSRVIPSDIVDALDQTVSQWPDAEALVDGDMRLTWREVGTLTRQAAAALLRSGVTSGDRVGIWAPNIGEWIIAALGAYRLGAVVVTVNTRFRAEEAGYVLRRAGVKLLFTVTDFLGSDYLALLQAAGPLPDLKESVILRGPAHEQGVAWKDFLKRGDGVSASELEALSARVDGNTVSDIIFTSGTTGAPKGAMLTHGSGVTAISTWNERLGMTQADRYLILSPLFHTFGLKGGALSCILAGATMLPVSVFDVEKVVALAEAERVTVLPGAPTIYQVMLDHPALSSHDLSSLRVAVTGAAAVPVELLRRMREEMSFDTVLTAYGLTEVGGLATLCEAGDPPEVVATTAGRPLPNLEVRIVDDQNRPLPAGEPGEVVIRGYALMKGYFGDASGTAAAIDADGFLHTGDIGVMDAAGNLRITDRKKDMFIAGGFNAYPAEIENIMMDHPQISQVAVIGVPDARLGEVGMAFVVPRPDAAPTPEELHAWCRQKMANYKVPRRYEIVDRLPLNATGKVQKFELRKRAAELA